MLWQTLRDGEASRSRTVGAVLAGLMLAWRLVSEGQVVQPPTFARDIAPIIWQRCAECHRPDGTAPFSLVSYADVRQHARQIADATRRL